MDRRLFLAAVLPLPQGQGSSVVREGGKPVFEGRCCFLVQEDGSGDEPLREASKRCLYFAPTRSNPDCTEMRFSVRPGDKSDHGLLGTCDGQDIWLCIDQVCQATIKPPVPAKKQPIACCISLPWGLIMHVYPAIDASPSVGQEMIQTLGLLLSDLKNAQRLRATLSSTPSKRHNDEGQDVAGSVDIAGGMHSAGMSSATASKKKALDGGVDERVDIRARRHFECWRVSSASNFANARLRGAVRGLTASLKEKDNNNDSNSNMDNNNNNNNNTSPVVIDSLLTEFARRIAALRHNGQAMGERREGERRDGELLEQELRQNSEWLKHVLSEGYAGPGVEWDARAADLVEECMRERVLMRQTRLQMMMDDAWRA